MSLSEAAEQKILVRWLRSRGVMFFSVPNEGKRSYRQATHLKARGLTPGVPDLIIVTMARDKPNTAGYEIPLVVCVELKSAKRKTARDGGLSPEQRTWHKAAAKHGWHVVVAYGAKDAVAQLADLGY